MRRVLLLGVLLLLCTLLPCAAQDEGSELDLALALFATGDVVVPYNDEGRAQLETAIEVFRAALGISEDLDEANEEAVGAFTVDLSQKDLVNKLSQAYYTFADVFLDGAENERETYLKGKHWGMKSLRMDAEFARLEAEDGFVAAVGAVTDIAALYWTAANWLRASEFNKIEAIFAGVPEKTEAMSLRCLELDDTFNSYGSYRALGAFWGGMPKLPAGTYRKNFNKSLSYFCKVVDEPTLCAECNDCPDFGPFDPAVDEYLENRILFVEFYLIEKGYWEDAQRILQQVLSEPIGDEHPLYNALAHEEAAKFLEEVEEHL